MTIHFFIKYRTSFGESLFITGDHALVGDGDLQKALPMAWFNDAFWHAIVEFPIPKVEGKKLTPEKISYRYFVKDNLGINVFEGEVDRYVELSKSGKESVSVIVTWNAAGDLENVFFTKAFNEVLLPEKDSVKSTEVKDFTHEFRVKAPLLKPGQTIILLGSTANLKSWNKEDPIFLTLKNNWFTGRVHLKENEWPATYKYGIYDVEEKKSFNSKTGKTGYYIKRKKELLFSRMVLSIILLNYGRVVVFPFRYLV